MYIIHRRDRDEHWQQLGTPPILISIPQWLHRLCDAPKWFYRVSKKLPVKSGIVIYSHVVDVSGKCMSVSLNWISVLVPFRRVCKSSHI